VPEGPRELGDTVLADGASTPAGAADVGLALAAGVVLAGRWEVLGLLGSGGMGSVYRARDRELDELVAVKVLRRELARTPAMLERFRREVKLARRVTHPNVARTFDIGEHGELRFLTMELLDGRPLSAMIARERRLSPARAAALGRAVGAGLAAAHAAGVVHRDLKPDNVVVERSGRVVITDFGIARALEAEGGGGETQGAVLGTPLYMAPEQVTHAEPIGPAADVFALGCMLFEMVTGRPPWTGATPLAIAAARLVGEAPDPSALAPGLPPALVDLIRRMLARQVAGRPASAEEVQAALAATSLGVGATTVPSLAPPAESGRVAPPSASIPSVGGASSGPWSAPKSLAVLPIENRGTAADAYLAAGLTDDLVDLLSGSPGLRVRPRSVAERAARGGSPDEGPRDPREVGRELDVQAVVSGELRRHGDLLQASVRVVTVEDGFQLWAGRFRTPADEFLRIGDEAAAAIAGALTAPHVSARVAPTDARAIDLHLRGRYLLRRTWGATPEAIPLLREAVERAPHDPEIRLTYARALVRAASVGEAGADAAATAWGIIDEALRAEPDRAEARLARGALHVMRGELFDGLADLRAALEGAPDLHEALTSLGDVLVDAGAIDGARALLERAIFLEPEHLLPRMALARLRGLHGDAEGALEALGEAPPDAVDAGAYWVIRARLALWSNDRREAELIRARYVASAPPGLLREAAGIVSGVVLGDVRLDDALVRERFAVAPGSSARIAAFHHQFGAEIMARGGDLVGALAAVVAAEQRGAFDVLWVERCPALAPVRGEAAFRAAAQRIEARAERVRLALGDLASGRVAGRVAPRSHAPT
jgi:serine/threonine-protein kinase